MSMADIQIRRVRASDAEGMARLMGDPATLGNLLQLPYPSVEAWRTRLADNDAAIALYRKFGFEIEGTHRAYALRDGAYVDVHAMSRLHPNPPTVTPG